MKVYKKIQYIYDSLINVEKYVEVLSSRGNTSLSTYLENFAAQLLEIFYGYKFINLNYKRLNTAGIDLINENQNHGVQVTMEKNNANKVIESINKSNVSQLTVFFFNHNKTATIRKHIIDKGCSLLNIDIISLSNIFEEAERDPVKAKRYNDLCRIWVDGKSDFDIDFVEIANVEMLKKVEANKLSKKYIPEIYIPEIALRKESRLFSDTTFAKQLLVYEASKLYQGSVFKYLSDKMAKLKDGTTLVFKNDCDATIELKEPIENIAISSLLSKLRNYSGIAQGTFYGVEYFNKDGEKIEFDEVHSNLNCGLHFTIDNLLDAYELSQKQYFFIVKDAGQGKTNFLCDFCSNVLYKRNIPVIYINVNELTKNLLQTVQEQLQMYCHKDLYDSLDFINQYCSAISRNFIIVIDGLNEKNNLSAFRNEVLELFRFVENNRFFKIIATSRNVAYQTFYKSFESESFGEKIYCSLEQNLNQRQRKNKDFQQKIFQRYKEYFNFSCFVSKAAKNKLSNDTLLLRIFSEVYQNKPSEPVNDIFLYKLFSEYINKRAIQLEQSGKLKRRDDLVNLLLKIAKTMMQSKQMNYVSNAGFSTEEKDLLDLIVNEDILIKTYEDDAQTLLLSQTNYSFTYDEFRDFLIACNYVNVDDLTFSKDYHDMAMNKGRYDGILKYLFLIFKSNNNPKLYLLPKETIYDYIYSANLFSLEDDVIVDEDIKRVENALSDSNEWVFYNLCNRLNIDHFKNLSVINIVNYRVNNFTGKSTDWVSLFVHTNFAGEEAGILPELLQDKLGDTAENEVLGILALLATFTYRACYMEEPYIKRLYKDFPTTFKSAIGKLQTSYPSLSNRIKFMSEAVK